MKSVIPDLPNILFIFSDTGGGHRSAAEAIIEALYLEFSGRLTAEMVDIFRDYAPPPFSQAPEIYPPLSRMPEVWGLGYRMSDGQKRVRVFTRVFSSYLRRASRQLVREHPCSMVVSVHPLTNAPVRRAIASKKLPFATVVTDMVTTHAFWYDPKANLVVVPTESARQRGLELGVPSERMKVAGQPVADRFCHPVGDTTALRKKLDWESSRPIVLLVGGGDGMGPLKETALAINEAELPVCLMIVTGRNRKLMSNLQRVSWKIPVKIYGFVKEMPEFMQAADILITKAGPGTMSEAFIAGLPIIMFNRMPGQEDGNVTYVVGEGAGVWAPEPPLVVNALKQWIERPEARQKAIDACKRIARPNASRDIARALAAQIEIMKEDTLAGQGR